MAVLTEDCRKEIVALLDKGGSLVGQMTRLFDLLRAKGLLWESILPCNQIGVHPMNRNGAGTTPHMWKSSSPRLLNLGSVCLRPSAFALRSPQATQQSQPSMNPWQGNPKDGWRKLFRDASVSGSHTCQALRMLLASCKHPNPTLTKDGMLSMSAVRLTDAWLADAAETGLKWTVLSHELFNIPRVADLVQAGMNCTNHTTLPETELQLCQKSLEKVVQRTKRGKRACNGLTSRRRCYGQSLQGNGMPLHVRVCLQVWGRNLGLAQAWFFLGHAPSDNLYYFTSCTIFQASGKKADFMSKTESFVRAFGRPEIEWWAAISSETFCKLKGGAAIPRQNGRVEQQCEAQLLQQRVPHENPGVRENPQHSGANGQRARAVPPTMGAPAPAG